MKDILIIAHYTRDFSSTDNGRFNYIAKNLSCSNKVEIITTDFSHSRKAKKSRVDNNLNYKVTFINEPGYKKNVSLSRIISHIKWGKEVYSYLKNRDKPDVIYCAVPSLSGPLRVSKYCKDNNIKFIIDIQDLWPEAYKMIFDVPILSKLIFWPLKHIADKIYRRADIICGVSETYVNRALKTGDRNRENHVVYLGTKLRNFDYFSNREPTIKKDDEEKWIGYCGSLSSSYDITCVIDALNILKEKGLDTPYFIVMGDGEKKSEFENYAVTKNIKCLFTGRLSYDKMCSVLSQCDIVVNPIKGKSAASIINKHGDYASAGVPVINTQDSREYRNLVEQYKMGFNCENSSAKDVADKIELLLKNPNLSKKMGENARKCAEEKFDRDYTYEELFNAILR